MWPTMLTSIHQHNDRKKVLPMSTAAKKADWQIPTGLILLTAVPALEGSLRIFSLSVGTTITSDNARFFAAPLPVIIHIISASVFCLLGAFQFAPQLRRHRPRWHRIAGRVVVVAGIAAAFSGLWMTQFYPLRPHLEGNLLYGFRLFFGSAMILCIAQGVAAIRRREVTQHRAWMLRAYAIGQGAGTQVLIFLPWTLFLGKPSELNRDLLMGAAWVINLAVAEWLIRSRATPARSAAKSPVNLQRVPAKPLIDI
jgi:uncharacterized membrane protein